MDLETSLTSSTRYRASSLQQRMSDQIYLLVWTRTLDDNRGTSARGGPAAISAAGQTSGAGTAEDQVEVQERTLRPD